MLSPCLMSYGRSVSKITLGGIPMKKKRFIGSMVIVGSLLFGGLAGAAGFNGWPTLSQGSSGGYVTGLQAALYSYGQQPTIGSIDGSFGSGTTTGLKNMQKATGITSDGVAGSGTWNQMDYNSIFESSTSWLLHTPYSSTYQTSYGESGSRITYRLMYKDTSTVVQSGYVK